MHDLLPGARSRLTTIYMTTYVIGGALGSAGGSQAYEHWGWAGAPSTAAGFTVLGLVAWLADNREREHGSGRRPRRPGPWGPGRSRPRRRAGHGYARPRTDPHPTR
ncbi:MAG: hypothetical protein ACLPKE_22635 [Streptosporangiaceae bacterium]